ncbi:MAG TPA: GNAT family N-acetyltransferase [Flavisolibacter sp.]|nr:GNAT family N-acetyltransferase [Flavisolibacter sp.]
MKVCLWFPPLADKRGSQLAVCRYLVFKSSLLQFSRVNLDKTQLQLLMPLEWILKKFYELTPDELYAALQLRNEVFVVEQNCVFQDADGKDQASYHLLGYTDNKLIAYTRLVPANIIYKEPSIGRVVSSPLVRGTGAGRKLMQESINTAYRLFGIVPLKIGAQLYLKKFYESFGFIQVGEGYIEDGIPHIYMVKNPS